MSVLQKIIIVLVLGYCSSAMAAENLNNLIALNKLGDPQASLSYHPSDQVEFDDMMTQYHSDAKKGDSEAQVMLGMAYSVGYGIPQDIEAAEYWLDKALAQGNQDAVIYLDNLYMLEDELIEMLSN
ncbi:SEL1-like repeat protein [Psychrobacter sp. TB55-MNA-CIBAN-0194]|uniref:tetratricopeptide repeat protein n=1 Tax=Psychrobacter sp. TB55-MNA-CIBAN-0194 TaxID=3140445 RepID=UPI00332326BC